MATPPQLTFLIGMKQTEVTSCLHDENLKKAVIADLDRLAAEKKLSGLEKIKRVELEVVPFSAENDLLTPKMSLKRHMAKKFYQEKLNKLYSDAAEGTRV